MFVDSGFKPDAKESIRIQQNLPEDAEYSWKTELILLNVTDSTVRKVWYCKINRFDVDVEFACQEKLPKAMEMMQHTYYNNNSERRQFKVENPHLINPDVLLAKDAFFNFRCS